MRVTYQQLVDRERARVRVVDPVGAATELAAAAGARPPAPVVLDVREADELAAGAIKGALHIPRGLLEKHVEDLIGDRQTPVYVVCRTGHRAILAASTLSTMGYEHVTSIEGGLERWRAVGLDLERSATGDLERSRTRATIPASPRDFAEIRAAFPIVSRRVPVMGQGDRALVYLDHAASTHAPLPVLQRYSEFMCGEYANVHRGTHLLSRKATELFDECYFVVSDFIRGDLERDCLVFLGNTTQAIDLAAHVMDHAPGKTLITELEHHSNDLPHRRRGSVLRARIHPDGRLDMDHVRALLRDNQVKLVAVTGASNVTGWMPDVHALARLAHEHGALILVDAAQLLAHHAIDVRPHGHPEHLDFVAAAGHKAYAPFGAAFLYGPRGVLDAAPPYLCGGGTAAAVTSASVEFVRSPDRHQGGTPNIAGVLAMSAAIRFIDDIGLDRLRAHEVELTQRAMAAMREIDGVTLYGPPDPSERLGVLTFNVAGVSDQLAAAVLSEERALAVRNGRFCAHIHVDKLIAHQGGASPEPGAPAGAVRASFGLYNDESDVERLVEGVRLLAARAWVGRYRARSTGITAEFAGRCNDRWMEADEVAAPRPLRDAASDAQDGVHFAQLNPPGSTKTYLIADVASRKAMLVDPRRDQVDRYLAELHRLDFELQIVVDTHTHADYLSGTKRLKDLVRCQLAMHTEAAAPCVDRSLVEGDVVEVGSTRVEVWHTPGHTADAVCLLVGTRVLTGDTLWVGDCGRCEASGSPQALSDSLARLRQLPRDTEIFPLRAAEGRDTSTIARELETNPWLVGEREVVRQRLAAEGGCADLSPELRRANAACST